MIPKRSFQPYSLAQISRSRLAFVIFALLMLILVPALTGVLLNIEQRELLVATEQARERLLTLRQMTALSHSDPPLRQAQEQLDSAVQTLSRQQDRLQGHTEMLRAIQFTLSLTLGLLGLLACWYIQHTLLMIRRNVTELDVQNQKLASLFDTASHLSVSAPEAMHGYVTARVASILQAGKAAIWSYDHASQMLIPLTPACGFETPLLQSISLPVTPGEWAHTLLFKNRTALSADLANEPAALPYREIIQKLAVHNLVAVPLIAHGKPVGMLCAYEKQHKQAFSEDDARLLRTFAGQAAFVLHSAQLYARSLARSEQIATLANVTGALNASLDMGDMLHVFAREARTLVPFDRFCLALLPQTYTEEAWSIDEQKYGPDVDRAAEAEAETALTRKIRGRQFLTSRSATAVQNAPTSDVTGSQAGAKPAHETSGNPVEVWTVSQEEGIQEHISERSEIGLLDWTLTHASPLLVSDREAEGNAHPQGESTDEQGFGSPRPASLDNAEREENRENLDQRNTEPEGHTPRQVEYAPSQPGSLILVPLLVHNSTIGALQLESDHAGTFNATHLILARQLSGQLAAAVQNARLYQEAMRRADQLEWGMQETHHRIKNNLQAITAILDLQLMEAGQTISSDVLRHALLQVRAIATVHHFLSEDVRSGRVPLRRLLDTLIPMLVSGLAADGKQIQLHIDAEDYSLPSRIASAVALTVNELIINAVRHGGRGRAEVHIEVALTKEPKALRLVVRDDGPGFPKDYSGRAENIGLSLARTLIERDHGGCLTIQNCPGAEVTATIPYLAA